MKCTILKTQDKSSYKKLFLVIFCLFASIWQLAAQQITVTGTVQDEMGEPFPGVTIQVKGTNRGTTSRIDGTYSIQTTSKDIELEFSFVGYDSQVLRAPANGKLDVSMREATSELDEVVIMGYLPIPKGSVTGTVSSINSAELMKVPVTSAAEALTGKLSGVRVVTQDGEPGAEIDITVRGGMSITQGSSPLYIIDGFASDDGLKGLDISEIEAIDILKDASTTSIYGARGANGVVLIRTKSGQAGRTKVTYNAYWGIRELPHKLGVLNSIDYAKLQYEMAQRTGGTSIESFIASYGEWDDFQSYYSLRGLDWQDIMFGDRATYQSQAISVSGGSNKHKFMLNYSYTDEDGILMNTGNTRHSFRFNYEQELYKNINLVTKTSYNRTEKNGSIEAGKTLQNSLLSRPVGGLGYTDEELLEAMEDPSNNSLQNPRISQLSQLRRTTSNSLSIDAALNVKFLDHFTMKVSGGGTFKNSRADNFDDERSSAAKTRGGPFGSQEYLESRKVQSTNTLTYNDRFGLHDITVLAGTEYIKNRKQGLSVENRQFPTDNFGIFDLSLGSLPQKPGSEFTEDALISFFGQAFYNYDDRYSATFSLRSDGSSKFAKGNRWGYFPSGQFAWRINQEAFMKDVRFVSNLKLRLSYGEAGSDKIGNNRFRSTFERGWYTNGASEMPVLYPKVLANPDLKWETSVAANIGLDFGLFKNRLSGTIEYYKNKTKDLLLTSAIPSYTGYTSQTRNIGSLQNQGFEISLHTLNIKTKSFSWSTDFNISFNRNKVLSLTDTAEDYMLFKSGVGSYMDDYIVQIGHATGLIYGYVYDGLYGVDDFDAVYDEATSRYKYTLKEGILAHTDMTRSNIQPGSQRFKNVNDDDKISPEDRTIIGNTTPKHFGGITNNFTYKGLDLSIFMNWSYGNDILNYQGARLTSTYQLDQNQSDKLLDRFTYIDSNGNYVSEPEALKALNANAKIHGVKTNGPESNITYTSSNFVEDGSFLRINYITFGYTFPKKLLRKIGVSNLRLYTTVNNVHTFTKYSGFDPEVSKKSNGGLTPGVDWNAYPKTRSCVFGVNLTF